MRKTSANTGLAKVAVQCSADTFVVKIATFAKPENVTTNINEDTINNFSTIDEDTTAENPNSFFT
jgi:hypothetical protein